ncbi:MAG: cellulase family glycosylhydrolase [Clostridia bacterium]|nr:cellulase family glycosylhydrolase [Clostridia bacterium]
MKKLISLLLVFTMILTLFGCSKPETKSLDQYNNSNPKEMSLLTVKDGYIVNENDENVILKGVNLGNWLLWETWMGFVPEYTHDWAYYDTLQVLIDRFGEEKTAEIVKTYEENFITEDDIAQIEKLGFNCVRVPFWYRNFMTEDLKWLSENHDDNKGFQKLDWLISTCEKYGIYVMLDLHGAPGGQSKNHCTGKAGRNELYENENMMNATVELWSVIAERYKDNKTVCAYDLLNEPQNNGGYEGDYSWSAESEEAVSRTNKAYDKLYKAIREIDKNHIISFEGVWSTTVLPNPQEMGYENLLYQLHLYDSEKGMIRYRVDELKTARKDWGVAVVVGEYNNHECEEYAQKKYEKNDISRIKWTYKTYNAGETWGIFNKDVERIDIKTASYEEIITFIIENTKTQNFNFNAEEMSILR